MGAPRDPARRPRWHWGGPIQGGHALAPGVHGGGLWTTVLRPRGLSWAGPGQGDGVGDWGRGRGPGEAPQVLGRDVRRHTAQKGF